MRNARMAKVGYIVPEFPGQTHIFFWREIKRLEEMGVEVRIVSTRPPPRALRSHAWCGEAEGRTMYLATGGWPATISSLVTAAMRSSPNRWLSCVRSIGRAEVSIKERAQLVVMAAFGAKLGRIAKAEQWDHMHVHSCANAANIVAFASLLSAVPYSLTLHGALSDYGSNQAEKWRHAEFGIVITQRLFAEVKELLGVSVAEKTLVAPMGVNLEKFKRHAPYRPWNGSGPAQIYSVGRLNPGKGHDDLVRAIALLRQRGIDARLTIAGQDEQGGSGYQRTLQRLVSDLGLADSVRLPGAVSEDVILQGLLSSHVFALASHHEALGVAIMEAMAVEMPVVVTSVGGVAELVQDKKDGLLIDAGNPEGMARSIEAVLSDGDLAMRLAAASREKIQQSFQDTRSAEMLARHALGSRQTPK